MERRKFDQKIYKKWIAAWIVIYALILILGFFFPNQPLTTALKVGSVLFCSAYSFMAFPGDRFLQIAMLTTFLADCLLAKNNISIAGLTVFFAAQCLHLYRITKPKCRAQVAIWAAFGMAMIILNLYLQVLPPIYVICSFYAATLAMNVITSWVWHRDRPQDLFALCAFLGFALFACCDICTGVSYFSLTAVFPAFLYAPANFFAWFFYYPSQILISNSSKCATIEAKEGKC